MTELATDQSDATEFFPIANKPFVLATDLDGTFLGGSDEDRRVLYDWIEDNRATVGLIFVTGRDPEFIVEVTSGQGVPLPEYVVGDVGTTIAEVSPEGTVEPIPELEADIAAAWNDGGPRVRAALEGIAGLTVQPTGFRYRVSYDLEFLGVSESYDETKLVINGVAGLKKMLNDRQELRLEFKLGLSDWANDFKVLAGLTFF